MRSGSSLLPLAIVFVISQAIWSGFPTLSPFDLVLGRGEWKLIKKLCMKMFVSNFGKHGIYLSQRFMYHRLCVLVTKFCYEVPASRIIILWLAKVSQAYGTRLCQSLLVELLHRGHMDRPNCLTKWEVPFIDFVKAILSKCLQTSSLIDNMPY